MAEIASGLLQGFVELSNAISVSGTIAWLPEEILQDSLIATPTGLVRKDWRRNVRPRDSIIFRTGISR